MSPTLWFSLPILSMFHNIAREIPADLLVGPGPMALSRLQGLLPGRSRRNGGVGRRLVTLNAITPHRCDSTAVWSYGLPYTM